jgi:ADP-heptose:LPS heptosyltransferase
VFSYLNGSLRFTTDGHATLFQPGGIKGSGLPHILVLTQIHVQMFSLHSVRGVFLSNAVEIHNNAKPPEIYDGTQDVSGKSIVILMLNGWGDMILIQPALRAFYERAASSGDPPRITLACNWIHNFPYSDVPYVQTVRQNILTVKELCSFDLLANLISVNHQRSLHKSMKYLCLEALKLDGENQNNPSPSIAPDHERVSRIRAVLDDLRWETGKKLLCVNWKSRFHHKNASPVLFSKIISKLCDRYQAVVFKDSETSEVMQQEIEAQNLPIQNLSYLINDYHDTVAALSLVDAFISVDTGIVHAAGAMGVPGVALFGPFPPETHVADYPSVIGFREQYKGRTCKVPCLETHRGCAEVGFSSTVVSPCFESIDADCVIDAFESSVKLG